VRPAPPASAASAAPVTLAASTASAPSAPSAAPEADPPRSAPECEPRASGDVSEAAAIGGRLFVLAGGGRLTDIDPASGSCAAVLTLVTTIHAAGDSLFALRPSPNGQPVLHELRGGSDHVRATWPGHAEGRYVLSDLDGTPLIVERDRIWLERNGSWQSTNLPAPLEREPGGVVGIDGVVYIAVSKIDRASVVRFAPSSGGSTSVELGGAISALVLGGGSRCPLAGTRFCDLMCDGAVWRVCSTGGASETARFPYGVQSGPLTPESVPILGLAVHRRDTFAVLRGNRIRRLARSGRPGAAIAARPACMCNHAIAKIEPGVFAIHSTANGEPLLVAEQESVASVNSRTELGAPHP
jgi:hypothetical protein